MTTLRTRSDFRRIDSNWPQTEVMPRIRTRVLKQEPLIDWRNPLEVGGVISACIGIAVVIGMWAGLLL